MSEHVKDIDLTEKQYNEVIALLERYIPDVEVWAYGSRVKFTAKPSSDLDMVAFATAQQERKVYELRDAFEDSYLPFRVDLFIWNDIPEQFQQNINKEHIVLQNNKGSV